MGGTFDLFDGHCDGQNGLRTHFARQCYLLMVWTSLYPSGRWIHYSSVTKSVNFFNWGHCSFFLNHFYTDFGWCQSRDSGSNFERLVVISVQFSRNTGQIIGYRHLPTPPPPPPATGGVGIGRSKGAPRMRSPSWSISFIFGVDGPCLGNPGSATG